LTAKESVRRLLLQRRNKMPQDRILDASGRIRAHLRDLQIFSRGSSVALYHPTGSEVRTEGAIADAVRSGAHVLLPRVRGDDLTFRAVTGTADLEPGRFGIMEPPGGCPEVRSIDTAVVPAVGVDRDGHRLGYGRGYYDRFLAGTGALAIALAYSWQVADAIPHGEHDVRVHWIVTEDGAVRTGRGISREP
jgi:5-formyltetrahydrofolate cyclo-ligase